MSLENKQIEEVKKETPVSEIFATVNVPKLNIRKRPSVDSEVLYIASAAESLRIQYLQNSDWVRVISGPVSGFCDKQYITIK